MEESIYINNNTIERYAKKIERENLREKGTSLSWSGIARSVKLLEVQADSDLVLVSKNWKESINKHKK